MPLYYKDSTGVHPVPLGDTPSVVVNAYVSADRANVHPSGTPFDVPAYTPGSGELQVFVDGLLCVKGQQYDEISKTTIAFTFDLSVDTEVTAVATTSGTGSVLTTTATSESRDAVISAGSPWPVTPHAVGSDLIEVYLYGLQLQKDVHFHELSGSAIAFTSDIPTTAPITTVVTTVS